ncbi:hypothetical protein E2C01_045055 [Portunus trituberculatus]|uniref:Uncharacterized protein n=1 Tax=Portunus trituberculatus TaxID=210409 RepID=A0A5B7FX81_PORTR|nr:hypothetical protein [Portunus trituberculatus]
MEGGRNNDRLFIVFVSDFMVFYDASIVKLHVRSVAWLARCCRRGVADDDIAHKPMRGSGVTLLQRRPSLGTVWQHAAAAQLCRNAASRRLGGENT